MNVTDRQIEALAQLVLGRNLRDRLDGTRTFGGSAGLSGLLTRLERAELITPRRSPGSLKLTLEGCKVLTANFERLPLIDAPDPANPIERQLGTAIAKRRGELLAEELAGKEQLAEYARAAGERLAKRAAAIPTELEEICRELGVRIVDGDGDEVGPAVLVPLWRAIVAVDKALSRKDPV